MKKKSSLAQKGNRPKMFHGDIYSVSCNNSSTIEIISKLRERLTS